MSVYRRRRKIIFSFFTNVYCVCSAIYIWTERVIFNFFKTINKLCKKGKSFYIHIYNKPGLNSSLLRSSLIKIEIMLNLFSFMIIFYAANTQRELKQLKYNGYFSYSWFSECVNIWDCFDSMFS